MNNARKSFLIVATLLVTIPAVHFSQARHSKELNKRGWWIPNIRRLAVENQEVIEIEGQKVKRTTYKLADPRPTVRLKNQRTCEFQTLSSYWINNEIFALRGNCVRMVKDPRFGKVDIGAQSDIVFYDMNGDKKFETRVTGGLVGVELPGQAKAIPPPSKIY